MKCFIENQYYKLKDKLNEIFHCIIGLIFSELCKSKHKWFILCNTFLLTKVHAKKKLRKRLEKSINIDAIY